MTPDEAFIRLTKYCTYQERCHEEVRSKLISLKVYNNDLEQIISRLIEHNFLNEERYAKSYAGSKFRQLHWGKTKIVSALKFRKVSEYCIKEALKEIDEPHYRQVLKLEIEKRKRQLKDDKNALNKTASYLIGKGFEPNLVWNELKAEE